MSDSGSSGCLCLVGVVDEAVELRVIMGGNLEDQIGLWNASESCT